jgi:hypothetical protein
VEQPLRLLHPADLRWPQVAARWGGCCDFERLRREHGLVEARQRRELVDVYSPYSCGRDVAADGASSSLRTRQLRGEHVREVEEVSPTIVSARKS